MRWSGVVVCFVLGGCAGAPTTLLVTVSDGDSGPPPTALTVSLFDPHRLLGRQQLTPVSLPGTLVARGLPDVAGEVRVVVVGQGDQRRPRVLGGERVQTVPHAQVALAVSLHASRQDSDGDGVPDDLDDCPTVPDPDQASAAGGPPGDACATVDAAVDSAAPDASTDALGIPPSLCATAQVALCDGFETGLIDGQRWTLNQNGGVMTVDASRAYRGSFSLKAHNGAIPAGGVAEAGIGETQTFPMSDFFIRAFVYVESPVPPAGGAVLIAEQPVSPYHGLTLNFEAGSFSTFNNASSPSVFHQATVPMPTDRWVCLEWEVSSSVLGQTRLWVEGVEVAALSGTQNTATAPAIGQISFGLSAYQPAAAVPARDLWLDELIVDGSPIGCTK